MYNSCVQSKLNDDYMFLASDVLLRSKLMNELTPSEKRQTAASR